MSESDDWTAERAAEFRKARAIPGVGIGPLEVVPPEQLLALAPAAAQSAAAVVTCDCRFLPPASWHVVDEPDAVKQNVLDRLRAAFRKYDAACTEPCRIEPAAHPAIQIHWERWTISLFGVEYSLELFAALAGSDLAMYRGPGALAAARCIAGTLVEVAARPDDGVLTLRRLLPPTPV